MRKILILLIIASSGLFFVPENKRMTVANDVSVRSINSDLLTKEIAVESTPVIEEVTEVEQIEEEVVKKNIDNTKNVVQEKIEEKEEKVIEPVIKDNALQSGSVRSNNEVLSGKMSAYGPDCNGCSGYLASGRYAGDGNVYYDDATYGKLRIVAGDSKFSFGTVVKITDKNGEFLAIVLDRGGVGLNKKYMFDLLFTSEEEASKYGVSNASFEILRNGY